MNTMVGVYLHTESGSNKLRQSLHLIWALLVRDIKGRYRRSLLGISWAVLPPMFYTGVFWFLQSILGISSGDTPYVIFAYSAMVLWSLFSSAVNRCGSCISANAGVVKKMAMAHEVFPVSAVLMSLFDFTVSCVLLGALLAWYQVPLGWPLAWLPALIGMTALCALAIGMLVAAIGTYAHDVLFAVPLLLQVWLLVTPIMYPLSQVPDRWHTVYLLNPMVGLIEGFRNVLIKNTPPDLALLGLSFAGTVLLLLVAWPLFRYMAQYFADVM
jgi:lipopolysaccharide transport system permease protein